MVAILFHAQFRQKYYRVFGFAIRCGIFSGFSSEYAPHPSQPFARLLGMRDSRDRSQNMTPKGLCRGFEGDQGQVLKYDCQRASRR